MPRNPPGTVKREAPPGPTMTEAEFRVAMEQLAQDAARWRWIRLHWAGLMNLEVLPSTGGNMQAYVDSKRSQ